MTEEGHLAQGPQRGAKSGGASRWRCRSQRTRRSRAAPPPLPHPASPQVTVPKAAPALGHGVRGRAGAKTSPAGPYLTPSNPISAG